MKLGKQNNSVDAILLALMRLLTILVNMLSTAILSRNLSLDSYGTYASANLVVNLFTTLTQLGLMDAVNYYYHQKKLNSRDCINTIFFIQICIGLACGGVILGGQRGITAYFDNPGLAGLYGYLALRPMMGNLFSSLLVLQMSIGKARAVAVRNALMALAKLITILITSFLTRDIATIFIAYLLLDGITLFYFYRNFRRESFAINPFAFKGKLIKPIMAFAVPMGIYVMANSLSRDMDKLVIGYFENTQTLAVYANCSTLLPFDMVSAAFLTIMIPIMTQLVQNEEYERGARLFGAYLRVGFITTFMFTGACIVMAEEVIMLLYGGQYLSGKWIFVLYTLVDMAKFAGVSLVLSAKGRTKMLMAISLGALACNAVLNPVLYWLMGVPGPAVATVMITLGTTAVLLAISSGILKTSIHCLLEWKCMSKITAFLLIAMAACAAVRHVLVRIQLNFFAVLICGGVTACGLSLLLCRKDLTAALRSLNRERVEKKRQE